MNADREDKLVTTLVVVALLFGVLSFGLNIRKDTKSSHMASVCRSHGFDSGEWSPTKGDRCITYHDLNKEKR